MTPTPDLATLLTDSPWRQVRTSYGEAWLVTASGVPLAKLEQPEVARILLAGAELHGLADAVERLVRASRAVGRVPMRFPTDEQWRVPVMNLVEAARAVGGDEPPGTTGNLHGGAASLPGAPGGSSALASPPAGLSPAPTTQPAPDEVHAAGGGAPACFHSWMEYASRRKCRKCGAVQAWDFSSGSVPQADGHAEPPDEPVEDSMRRHHLEVPPVTRALALPRDVHREEG